MNARRLWALAICLALAHPLAWGDELKPIRDLGKKALNSFHDRHDDDGRRYFEQFLQRVKSSPAAVQDPQIELMLGILGCAMPEHRDLGKAALKRFLQRSKDVGQNRASIENLLQACSSATAVELPAAASLDRVIASASSGAPGVSGTSKGGDPSMKPVAGVAVSPMDPAEMDKRLEETRDPQKALAPTLARLGTQAKGTVTDYFIVATDGGGEKLAQGIAKCLDDYRAGLNKEFGMLFPSHRITVYNTQWEDAVYENANRLHGLNLASGTIAYSVYADLSMVGVANAEVCGSLAHELTHLMIRGNFGDAPAWLEEGLASAVALSVPEQGHLSFRPGWRDRVLRSEYGMRPSASELLNLTWADFSPAVYADLYKTAAIQAMASVFVRYLAERKKLDRVYFAFRAQNLMADLDHYRTPQQIVEKELGKSMAEIDQDFAAWFIKQPANEPTRPANIQASDDKTCIPAANASPMAQQPAPCEPEVKNRAR